MLLLVGATVLMAITMYWGISLFLVRGRVQSTIGRVIDISKSAGEHFLSQNMAQIGYSVRNEYHVSQNRILVSRMTKTGDEMQIKYYTQKPDKLFTKTFIQFVCFLSITLLCLILFFLLYGNSLPS